MTVVIGLIDADTAHDVSAYPRRNLPISDDRIFTRRPTVDHERRRIIDQDMFRSWEGRASGAAPQADMVLLCGGTELERAAARSGQEGLINGSDPVVVMDLQSLLRCAPHSRAVIICGQLAGVSSYSVERLIKQRAPQATLVRADRTTGPPGPAGRRGRHAVLRRLVRTPATPR